ncbi:MAG TPA: glutathione S-transferase family protein [Gaiellaceae bacterium]|jgi:glutathione S-transferase|nr:glutathione S-transferase family protein [Gaiellaceae bacterium]
MILYNSSISGNCYKVRLLLARLGVDYETREVEVVDRTAPRDELAELNPTRRVPTVVLDDGRPLAESNAILWYFGDGTPWVPDDSYERAQVLQWLFFEQYEHEPAIAVARFLVSYSQLPREQYERRLPRLEADGAKALAAMERHLATREWLVGESPTIADISLYAYTHAADEGGFDLQPYPAVLAWLARFAALPGHVPLAA